MENYLCYHVSSSPPPKKKRENSLEFIYMQSKKIHKVFLKHFVYLVGLHIYYKMIHDPYNIKSIEFIRVI